MSDWNKPISIVAWSAFGALGIAIAAFLYKDINHSKEHDASPPATKRRQTSSRGGRKRHNVTQRKQK